MTAKSNASATLNQSESRGFIAIANLERRLGRQASNSLVDVVHQDPIPQREAERRASVILSDSGSNRMAVLRTVREITGLGPKQAKALVDSIPSTISSDLSKSAAEEIAQQLRDVGAEVEVA